MKDQFLPRTRTTIGLYGEAENDWHDLDREPNINNNADHAAESTRDPTYVDSDLEARLALGLEIDERRGDNRTPPKATTSNSSPEEKSGFVDESCIEKLTLPKGKAKGREPASLSKLAHVDEHESDAELHEKSTVWPPGFGYVHDEDAHSRSGPPGNIDKAEPNFFVDASGKTPIADQPDSAWNHTFGYESQ